MIKSSILNKCFRLFVKLNPILISLNTEKELPKYCMHDRIEIKKTEEWSNPRKFIARLTFWS